MSAVDIWKPKMDELWRSDRLSKEERAVLKAIWNATAEGRRISQRKIAQTEDWLGCHQKYEGEIVEKKSETTLRQVRQIIRDLRVKYGAPILSNNKGYWLPVTMTEVEEYIERMEATARAQAASWHQTYKAVRDTFNVQSSFFDKWYDEDEQEITSGEGEVA